MFGVVLVLALQTSTEMSSPSFPVNVRGVAKIERGIKLYRFRASGGVPDTSTRCVSVCILPSLNGSRKNFYT